VKSESKRFLEKIVKATGFEKKKNLLKILRRAILCLLNISGVVGKMTL